MKIFTFSGMLAWLLLAWLPGLLWAQTYRLPTTGIATYTTCGGTLYDDGGPSGPYSAICNGSVTLRPATAGNKIRLAFTEFALADALAVVIVLDGASTSAPIIGIYSAADRPRGPLYASNADGALTVQLRSGLATAGAAGIAATIACVGQAPLPDLAAQNLRLRPASLLAGATTAANVQLLNLADGPAPSSTAAWYVSRDSLFSRDDVFLQTSQSPVLVGQAAVTSVESLPLPASLEPGWYYVLLVMDQSNRVAESNETNNVASARLRIVAPAPDLQPTQVGFQPYSITSATTYFSIEFSISNRGVLPTDSSQVGLFISDRPSLDGTATDLGRTAIEPLLAGANSLAQLVTVNMPPGMRAGSHYVFVVADYTQAISELDEANNVLATPFLITTPSVDLGLQYPLGPRQISPGQVLNTLYVRLNNQGSELAIPATLGYFLSTDKTFSADDVLMGSNTLGLSPYSDMPVYGRPVVPAGTAPGQYYLLYVADYLNQLAESDETNNVEALPLAVVTPDIDLILGQPYLVAPYRNPDRAVPGQSRNLAAGAYLFNQGTTVADVATLGLYLSADKVLSPDDQLLAADSIVYLPPASYPSQGLSFGIPASTKPGHYYVLLVADYRHRLPDTNRSNNVVAQPLDIIAPDIDLEISYVSPLPTSAVTTGERLGLSSTLSNQGQTTALPATVGYYLSRDAQFSTDDVRLGQRVVQELDASTYGGVSLTDTVTVPITTTAGAYYLLLVANDLGLLPERNKTNNVYGIPLTVSTERSDLTVQAASLAPATTTCGTQVAVSCTVANIGAAVTNRTTALGYYLSTDNRWDPSDQLLLTTPVLFIFPGQREAYSAKPVIPAGLPPGRYYLLLVIDPGTKLLETTRNNNVSALALTLTGDFAGGAVPASGAASISACAGLLYDNGGLAAYVPYSNGTLTINPAAPNARTQLIFSEFDMEPGPHYLQVYDGPSSKSPLLAMYTGHQLPPPVTASLSNPSGALTLRFVSSGSTSGSGFVARFGCVSRITLAGRPASSADGYALQVTPVPVVSPAPLRVQLTGPGLRTEATLALYNSLGQVVATQRLAPGRSSQAELPTAGLAAGVYVVRLVGPDLHATSRVIVE